jgi:ribosomal protein S18 acetylase RimI-like enzyme
MFATPELAARIDRAEGRLCAGLARVASAAEPTLDSVVVELAGGLAVYAGAGSPTNKMIGVGFGPLPTEYELANVERLFAERAAPLQAEVSSLADPALHAWLVARGYEPRGFENVLGHPLTDLSSATPEGITVEPADIGERTPWVDAAVAAFARPDTGGVGGDAIPPSDDLRRWVARSMDVPGFECLVARLGGQLVGYGSLRVDAGIGQLCGAGTLPAYRRRGVQTAMLRWRLARAREARCELAVVTTQPASKSQQNVQRAGFSLLYVRQILVKPPA